MAKSDKIAERTGESRGLMGKVEDFKNYLEESKAEIKKVVWPTRKETLVTCGAVLVLVTIMAIYLGLVDFGLSHLMRFILS